MRITFAPRLTANRAERTISGTLLPFGEEGSTNVGKIIVNAGAVTIPAAPELVILNLEHDPTRAIGTGLALTETDQGIRCSFKIAEIPEGDEALTQVEAGFRTGLSVEIDVPEFSSTHLTAGALTGAALVETPAFPSARIQGTQKKEEKPMSLTAEEIKALITETITASLPQPPAPATVPSSGPAADGDESLLTASLAEVAAVIAGSHQSPTLLAALKNIVPANTSAATTPQFVQELWDGAPYERVVIPAFNRDDLTSTEVKGWKVNPEKAAGVAEYSGNLAEVPSMPFEIEPATAEAKRYAGANKLDRKFRDFNDQQTIKAYLAAMALSAKITSDEMAFKEIKAGATAFTADLAPTGVERTLTNVVKMALEVNTSLHQLPNTIWLDSALFADLVLLKDSDKPAYLEMLADLSGGKIDKLLYRPMPNLAPGEIIVSCRQAATVYEPSGTPISVDALDIARGGWDNGLFGYLAVIINDSRGILKTSLAGTGA